MDRRENLKLMFVGSFGAGLLVGTGCKTDTQRFSELKLTSYSYGRTDEEKIIDEKIQNSTFFTYDEKNLLTVLVDIIIPKDEISCSASEAGVTDFIEFMMKDQPKFQTQMRGGLMWLNSQSQKVYVKSFIECSTQEQLQIIDLIAYPDTVLSENKAGSNFFTLLRNLTATGFFTSKQGLADLGYVGNRPNEWNGVPDEVLKKHNLSYDQRTLDICIKTETKNIVASWDEDGNLL